MSSYKGLSPTFQRILVKRKESEEKIGSIIIPDKAKVKATVGTIIALGPEAADHGFEVGQDILFGHYSGFEYEWADERLVMMNAEDVVAVVKDPNQERKA